MDSNFSTKDSKNPFKVCRQGSRKNALIFSQTLKFNAILEDEDDLVANSSKDQEDEEDDEFGSKLFRSRYESSSVRSSNRFFESENGFEVPSNNEEILRGNKKKNSHFSMRSQLSGFSPLSGFSNPLKFRKKTPPNSSIGNESLMNITQYSFIPEHLASESPEYLPNKILDFDEKLHYDKIPNERDYKIDSNHFLEPPNNLMLSERNKQTVRYKKEELFRNRKFKFIKDVKG